MKFWESSELLVRPSDVLLYSAPTTNSPPPLLQNEGMDAGDDGGSVSTSSSRQANPKKGTGGRKGLQGHGKAAASAFFADMS